jgi:uncharacterized metal-binding protein
MKYHDPACAYCPDNVRACRVGESAERCPGYCPTKVDQDGIDDAAGEYEDAEVRRISQVSAVIEADGYCKWTRVEEICEFAKRMGFKKVGIATCISFVDHAKVLSGILESHGLSVASVACKHGGIPKEELRPPGRGEDPPRQLRGDLQPGGAGGTAQARRLRAQHRARPLRRP